MDVRQYADLFLSESRDHLTTYNQLLLAWEKDHGTPEAVDGIFRAVHTIKGMAATMGYGAVADLAHRIENLLDAVRSGSRSATPRTFELLFRAGDALEHGIAAAVEGRESAAYGSLIEALDREAGLTAGETGLAEPGTAVASEPIRLSPTRPRHVRVDLRRLDGLLDRIGQFSVARGRLAALAARRDDPELAEVTRDVGRLVEGLEREVIAARMTPVWHVFDRFPRMVRDLARQTGKEVDFQIEGKDIELDRAILEQIAEPVMHLLRNAVDHGIEPPAERLAAGKSAAGRLVVAARRERQAVAIAVSDDGRGVDRGRVLARAKELGLVGSGVGSLRDEDLLRLLERPGFSTAARVTSVSGRGVGIDVVAYAVRGMGGSLEIRSEENRGATFTLRLPVPAAGSGTDSRAGGLM